MTNSKAEGYVRLAGGSILNLCLLPVFHGLSLSGNNYRDYGHALFWGALATSAVYFVVPTFWRGGTWQSPVAFVLLCVPGIVLFGVVQLIIGLL